MSVGPARFVRQNPPTLIADSSSRRRPQPMIPSMIATRCLVLAA
jgi:hypothetical protein